MGFFIQSGQLNRNFTIQVVGCDPLFDDVNILARKGEDIEYVAPDLYKMDFYSSINELREYRTFALSQFISDYPPGTIEKLYIRARLPRLPFDDKSFELVSSGHFLEKIGSILYKNQAYNLMNILTNCFML